MIEHQDYEFLQAFWTRRAVIAYSVFATNIIIFLLMTLAGGSENDATLMAFGVKSNFQIDNGEIWRFVTPIFIHIGILHLAFNSYALWVIGPQVEKLYGGPRFLLLYVLTGIAGVAASYWYHPLVPSAGASGAIFGMLGVLLVFSVKYRRTVPAFFSRALGKGILLTVGINLVIGWQIEQVDNAAHVGGLLAGALLALVVPFARPGEPERSVFKVAQAVLVSVVVVSFFQVATHYGGPAPSLTNLVRGLKPGGGTSAGEFARSMNMAQRAFENSEVVLESGDFSHLPDVEKELEQAMDVMRRVPSLSARADELSREFLELLSKQYEYVKEVQRTGRARSDFLGASPQSTNYKRLNKQIDDWVESEGASYGLAKTK